MSQAAARGQKQAAPTQPDENDPLKEQYGDAQLVQSQTTTERKWTRVEALNKDLENQQVHSGLLIMSTRVSSLKPLHMGAPVIYAHVCLTIPGGAELQSASVTCLCG